MAGTTYTLAIDTPERLRPAPPSRLARLRVERVEPPSGRLNRAFYEEVGGELGWAEQRGLSDAEWQRRAEQLETYVARVDDEDAAWYELRRHPDGSVEIVLFGVRAAWRGAGVGGALLTHATHTAFAQLRATRVWVLTTSADHAAALPNYQARGFEIVKAEPRDMGGRPQE